MSTQKSMSAPGEAVKAKRTSRRDKSCGSQGGGTGRASVGTSIHSSNNQCTETLATFVASKVASQTERIVTRSVSLTHIVVTTQSEYKETRGGSMKSQIHGYQSVLTEARSASTKSKTRAHQREHSQIRSSSIKYKTHGRQSEHSRTRSGSKPKKTCGRQSEHSRTRSGLRKSKTCRKSMEAKSGTIKSTICDFQIQAIETEAHSKKRAISVSPGQGRITKDTLTRRKHRGSEGGTNCTSMRGNKAVKPGAGSLANKHGSRAGSVADEGPQLEEGEIMEEESSSSDRCQSKRRRHSYKTRHSDSIAASTRKQFIGKVKIVDLGQKGNSFRDVHGQNVVKHGSASGARRCSEKTSSSGVWSTSAAVRTSMVDSFQLSTLNKSKAAEIKRLVVDQVHKCPTGTDALEEGEILSDSDITGNMSTNEVLLQSGSDMSISSEDSSPKDTVPVIEHTDRHMFAAAGTAAVPPGSNLDPQAAVFIPRSLSCAFSLAPQPNMTDTSGIAKVSAHAYNQPWPPFTAGPHCTQHQSQLWRGYQTLAHSPQTQGLDWHPARGHIPGSDADSFSAPLAGIFSSICSIWSYMAVLLQQQSQLVRGPSLGPTWPGPPGSSVWAARSTTISTEHTGQTLVSRIQLPPAAEHTCPEITSTDRCWQTVRPADVEAGSMELKVMSYNILSQDLMEKHMHLYSNCQEADLEWHNRGAALLTQIIAHNADIVCLQEVETDHWLEDIQDNLAQQGYEGVYKQQTGDSTHGCAILFKSNKFQQLKAVPVEFLKGGILDRHNIGLILLLQPRQPVYAGSVQKICVATTHLLFNPRRGDVKLAQLMVLLAEIDKHAYMGDQPDNGQCMQAGHKCCDVSDPSNLDQVKPPRSDQCENSQEILHKAAGTPRESQVQSAASSGRPGYCPIILCGDFNSEPFCDLYKFITEGYLKYDDCISRLLCGQEEGRWGGTDRLVDRRLMPSCLDICETCQYLHVLQERLHRGGAGGCQQLPWVNSGQVWHWMNFQSVYTHVLGQGYKNREISTYHNNSCCTVDYIFYSQTAARRKMHTLTADSENGDKQAAQTGDSQSHLQQADTAQTGDSQSHLQQADTNSAAEHGSDISASSVDSENDTAVGSADIDKRETCSADMQQAGDMCTEREACTERDTCTEPLELVARYRLLRHNELTKYGFMPNSVFPSDHLCLIARFVLR